MHQEIIMLKDKLTSRLGISEKKATKWSNKFYSEVVRELRRGYSIASVEQQETNMFPFDLTSWRRSNKFVHNKKLINLLSFADCITIVSLGNNLSNRRTIVETKIPLDLIFAVDEAEITEVVDYWYSSNVKTLVNTPHDKVYINEKSLSGYISNTTVYLNNKANAKVQKYLYFAKSIQAVNDLFGYLPHIINKSVFGRTYYKGLSLQNMPVVVREAALGKTTKIDINNSVFQWRVNTITALGSPVLCSETKNYLQYKKAIRRDLAISVFEGVNISTQFREDKIKEALTAISFGAKTKDTSYWGAPALREVFTPANSNTVMTAQLTRFLEDPFIMRFVAEQEVISTIIYDSIKDEVKELPESILLRLTTGRGLSKSKVLAFLYQQSESQVMQPIYDMLADKIQLKVHDGFYCSNLSPDETLAVRSHFQNKGYTAQIDKISSYTFSNGNDGEVKMHMERTRLAEIAAQEYTNTHAGTINNT